MEVQIAITHGDFSNQNDSVCLTPKIRVCIVRHPLT
jgi:hypothetical protein